MARPIDEDSWIASAAERAVLEAGERVMERAKATETPVTVYRDGRIVEVSSDSLLPNVELQLLAEEHREWLAEFDGLYLKQWEDRLQNDLKSNHEGALTEAAVRRLLQCRNVDVRPNEGPNGGPDFACSISGQKFYVEVTCISVEKATEKTDISTEPQGASHYRLLNDAISNAVRKKTGQCKNLDAPCLLAIGTFHGFAGMACFSRATLGLLHSGSKGFAWPVDPKRGGAAGRPYLYTELDNPPFLRPDPETGVGFARESISGLLICGVSLDPPRVFGLLHPNPVRPFDPRLLPGIEFATVQLHAEDRISVHWPSGSD